MVWWTTATLDTLCMERCTKSLLHTHTYSNHSHTLCAQTRNMHLFKSPNWSWYSRPLIILEQIIYYFTLPSSQRAHNILDTPVQSRAFAFPFAHSLAQCYSLLRLCPMKIKHFPIVCPRNYRIKTPSITQCQVSEKDTYDISIKIS